MFESLVVLLQHILEHPGQSRLILRKHKRGEKDQAAAATEELRLVGQN